MSTFTAEIPLVQGDDGPQVQSVIKDSKGTGAIAGDQTTWPIVDLTNFTVAAVASRTGPSANEIINVVILAPAAGLILLTPKDTTMINTPDIYRVEITLTNTSTGEKQTLPDWLRFVVRPRVA
jgi:hypothetical protein